MINSRQEKIFNFLKIYIEKYQFPPTIRDICQGAGVKSTSTVSNDLSTLEEEGYIKRSSLKSRSIEIVQKDDFYQDIKEKEDTIDIPVLGQVAAGQPIFAEENIDYYFPIPSYYSNKGDLFILKVKGESMIEAGILDGDKILVRSQTSANNGDIVVALIDDGATVKYFQTKNGRVELIPANSSMSPIIPDNLLILGKVIALFRENM